MRFSVKSLFAATVLGLSGLAAPAGAQDARQVSYEELLERVARLEQEMAEVPPAPDAPIAPPITDEITDDGGFYFMYENVIVRPYFSQNTSVVIDDANVAGATVRQYDWDFEYSPRFEVGHIDACTGTGWRARYWHFDHSTRDGGIDDGTDIQISPDVISGFGIRTIDAGEIASAQHSLRMSVADLEFLRRDLSSEGGFSASVGLRYARIDHWNRGRILDANNALLVNNALHHDFEGIGPTIAAEYVKRFECSYWGAFINARGALLYGDSNYNYGERDVNGALVQVGRNVNDQDLVSVVEMQIGLDYRRPTSSCHEFFLRIALETQYWHNAGSASADMTGFASDNAQETDLGFLGVSIGTGIDW